MRSARSAGDVERLPIPRCDRRRLDCGLTLLLVEKPGPPLVSFEVVVRTGAAGDPAGKEGLAAATFALLRKGTRRRSAQEFAAVLDASGALFGAAVDHDLAHLNAEFLSRDAQPGLDLVAEALLSPTFPAEEVEKRLHLAIEAIRDDKDVPLSVIGRYFDAALFDGHPYARPVGGTEASLGAIRRDEIAAFHEACLDPSEMILVVAGMFDSDAMPAMVERALAGLRGRGGTPTSPAAPAPEPAPARGRRVVLVDKPDEQTGYFRFGNIGIAFGDPSWVHVNLARTVLGGCFTSWLNTALRIEEGLTYGVFAEFSRRRRRGPFAISSFSRVDAVARAIDIALGQLERLHADGIDAETLRSAKNYIKGQFPLAIETADQLADAYARFEALGVPHEWLSEYLGRVERATADEVSEIARRVFPRGDDLVFTLIGPAERLAPVAERLGPVTLKRIDAPGF